MTHFVNAANNCCNTGRVTLAMFASWAYKYLWISGERVMWVYHHGMLTEEPDCCPNCTECKWACSYLIVLERKRTCCRMHINEWKYAKHITIWTALVLNEIVTAQNAVREAYLIRKLIAWIRRSRQQTYFFRILGFHCNMWVAWQLIFLWAYQLIFLIFSMFPDYFPLNV